MTISKWYDILVVRGNEDFAIGSSLPNYRDGPQEQIFCLSNDLSLETISVGASRHEVRSQLWDGLRIIIFLGLTKYSALVLLEVWEMTNLPIFVIAKEKKEEDLIRPNLRVTFLHWNQSDREPVLGRIRNYLASQNRSRLPDLAVVTDGDNRLTQIYQYQLGFDRPVESIADRARPFLFDLTGREVSWNGSLFQVIGDVEGQWQLDSLRILVLKFLHSDRPVNDKIVLLAAAHQPSEEKVSVG